MGARRRAVSQSELELGQKRAVWHTARGSGEAGLELKVGEEESAATTKMSHIHPPLLRGTRKCKYEPSWDGTDCRLLR